MEEVTAGVYLVSINRSRYSAVHGGKNGFPSRAAISAAAHQRLDRLQLYSVYTGIHSHSVHSVHTKNRQIGCVCTSLQLLVCVPAGVYTQCAQCTHSVYTHAKCLQLRDEYSCIPYDSTA